MTARRDALRSRSLVAMQLVQIKLESGPIRCFSGSGRYETPDGRVWLGTGQIGQVSATTVGEKVEATGFTVGLYVPRGDDLTNFGRFTDALRDVRSTKVRGAPVSQYIGVLDRVSGVLIDGQLSFVGGGVGSRLGFTARREGAGVALECEPRIAGMFPSRSLFLTNEDQQFLFPDDKGLEFNGTINVGGRAVTWVPGV